MRNFGYYQAACASFKIQVMDVKSNVDHIIECINSSDRHLQLMVFGELCITGYTCQDMFFDELLLNEASAGLKRIAKEARENILVAVGLPIVHESRLYNVAAWIFNHEILGFQAKAYLPNYNEFYEKRWFHSGFEIQNEWIDFDGKKLPITTRLLISDTASGAKIAAEICEDLWVPTPVSNMHFSHGANVIVNLSASDELISKADYRQKLVSMQSQKLACGYLYASGGYHESTSDMLFSSQQIIAENGKILNAMHQEGVLQATLDLEMASHERRRFTSLLEMPKTSEAIVVEIHSQPVETMLLQKVNAYPFVPGNPEKRCLEIMDIQARALSVRLNHLPSHRVVVGISGGLDSTLALLVCHRAYELNHWDPRDIIAITMPGFGTTDHTYQNALELIRLLDATLFEISIKDAATLHLKDIGHDLEARDITYENAQARERTQILMDMANKYNAIVIGTGDLSEMALGWCTYNGDHMSMYAVNSSIPKTLVSSLVATYAKVYASAKLHDVLMAIVATPISPELLPPDPEGKIAQKTESSIGKYKFHDFFLFYFLRYHFGPAKIFYLAKKAFPDENPAELLATLRTFYWRFFSQQFKRNCVPDGIKVGSVSLSPRADWRMPSDAHVALWMEELDSLTEG